MRCPSYFNTGILGLPPHVQTGHESVQASDNGVTDSMNLEPRKGKLVLDELEAAAKSTKQRA